jgi:hypothetical protein
MTRAPTMVLFVPIPGDPQRRSRTYGCTLQPEGGGDRFRCPRPDVYTIPFGLDIGVEVSDEALINREIKSVSTRAYVNGTLVTRVERFANGAELRHFRVDSGGNVR